MKNCEIYIHIPFCDKKCNYCDFVSFSKNNEEQNLYFGKLLEEIENKRHLASNFLITTIFIGGGTPSSVDSNHVEKIMEYLYKNYNIDENAEITIEVNPHSAIKNKLLSYKKSNINRLSIGLQSSNDDELLALGRLHSFSDFQKTFDTARDILFNNINVDLISGIPYETFDSFKSSLDTIINLSPEHISLYDLIIEPNTKFYNMNIENKLNLPDTDTLEKIDEYKYLALNNANYLRYEISNYSKKGYECKHNLGYWSNVPYLGFGLNASSYFDGYRFSNLRNFNNYLNINYQYIKDISKLEEIKNSEAYFDSITKLTKDDTMSEYTFLGFRKTAGINVDDFYKTFGTNFDEVFHTPICKYLNLGLIKKDSSNYYLSNRGIDISNVILSDFLL